MSVKVEIEVNAQMLADMRNYRRLAAKLRDYKGHDLDRAILQGQFDVACIEAAFNLDFALQEAGFDNPYQVRDKQVG